MSAKPNPIVRLLPSLTDLAFLMPLVFLFVRMGGATKMLEGDTGWHIRTGEWILANGRAPQVDFFSYSKPGEPWFAWEWGWDAIFAWLHGLGGMPAVVFASVMLLSVTFALLFRLVLRKSGQPIIAAAVTLLAIATSAIHWWARPHLVTFVFTVVFLSILERKREGGKNRLWVLPILTVLWTNLHGGFFVGILLLGCYGAGELIESALAPASETRRAAFRRAMPYLKYAAVCFAVTFINPYTYQLHLHIFQYLGDPESPFFRWVGEWQSLSFHTMAGRYFEAMILLGTASCIWSIWRRQFVYPVLVLGWMHLALVSARHIPIFAIVAAPVIAEAATGMLALLKRADLAGWVRSAIDTFDEISGEIGVVERLPRLHLISVASMVVLGLLIFAQRPPERFRADYDAGKYPKQAVDSLGPAWLSGNVFTNDEWGDYLIYRLYPSTKVFVDGRFDFYGADFTEEYLNVINAHGESWKQTLDGQTVSSVLLPAKSALTSTMRESGRWTAVYEDDVAVLLQAVGGRTMGETSDSSTLPGAGSTPPTQASRESRQLQSERRKSI